MTQFQQKNEKNLKKWNSNCQPMYMRSDQCHWKKIKTLTKYHFQMVFKLAKTQIIMPSID